MVKRFLTFYVVFGLVLIFLAGFVTDRGETVISTVIALIFTTIGMLVDNLLHKKILKPVFGSFVVTLMIFFSAPVIFMFLEKILLN